MIRNTRSYPCTLCWLYDMQRVALTPERGRCQAACAPWRVGAYMVLTPSMVRLRHTSARTASLVPVLGVLSWGRALSHADNRTLAHNSCSRSAHQSCARIVQPLCTIVMRSAHQSSTRLVQPLCTPIMSSAHQSCTLHTSHALCTPVMRSVHQDKV